MAILTAVQMWGSASVVRARAASLTSHSDPCSVMGIADSRRRGKEILLETAAICPVEILILEIEVLENLVPSWEISHPQLSL